MLYGKHVDITLASRYPQDVYSAIWYEQIYNVESGGKNWYVKDSRAI